MPTQLRVRTADLVLALSPVKSHLTSARVRKGKARFHYDGTQLHIDLPRVSVSMPAEGQWEEVHVVTAYLLEGLLKIPPISNYITFYGEGSSVVFEEESSTRPEK